RLRGTLAFATHHIILGDNTKAVRYVQAHLATLARQVPSGPPVVASGVENNAMWLFSWPLAHLTQPWRATQRQLQATLDTTEWHLTSSANSYDLIVKISATQP
ncbi:MAG: hypothetical protein R3C68_19965, partial [Myxococcota bacterium]